MSYKLDNIKLSKILNQASIAALEKTAEYIHTEVVQRQIMPRDTGHLQNESTYVDTSESSRGRVTLVSNTPYAARLYFHPEFNFSKEANPNAGAAWFDDYLSGSKQQEVLDVFAKFYKREAGL